MAVKLYGSIISPPTRAVLMCAKALGVDLKLIPIDLVASEQISEDFMKINPCHTIPVLEDDDGFIVTDSHVINEYLVDKYGKNDSLNPKDRKVRATINHRLHFDSSVFFVKGVNIVKPLVFGGGVQPDKTKLETLKEVFLVVERMLEQCKSLYIAGNELSIADFSFTSTITQWNIFVPYADFPNIKSYIERIQKLPFYEANREGLAECNALIASFLRRDKMGLKLYGAEISPCVRAVLLTIEALELKGVEFVDVDLLNGGTQTAAFSAINPLQKVPTIQDGDLILWDSHAINAYIVSKYGKTDSLYPKDPKKRALVDAMNFFDTGFLFAGHDVAIKSIVTSPTPTSVDSQIAKPLEEAYAYLNTILEKRAYVAGSQLTIADFSIATTLSSSTSYLPLTPGKHDKVLAWYQTIKSLPYFAKVNAAGLKQVKEVLSKKLA
ncbi:hypothetical protein YQE_03783, partial [Dendroctonus ponderosae]